MKSSARRRCCRLSGRRQGTCVQSSEPHRLRRVMRRSPAPAPCSRESSAFSPLVPLCGFRSKWGTNSSAGGARFRYQWGISARGHKSFCSRDMRSLTASRETKRCCCPTRSGICAPLEVDGLIASLVSEIKSTAAKETGRTGTSIRKFDWAKEPLFSDAFLDALADRLALRILNRAKGINPGDPIPKSD
jgi:hypothetical protein